MTEGRKRNIDSGRRDTLGRVIKVSQIHDDITLSNSQRLALREKDIITKRTKPTSRKLTGKATRFLQASKKAVVVGAVSVLSLGMGACSPSGTAEHLNDNPNITPNYAQICVDQNTNERLKDEECDPKGNHPKGINPGAAFMWMAFAHNNGTTYVPGVGQKVDVSQKEVRTNPPSKHKNSVHVPESGGNFNADNFKATSNNLLTGDESYSQNKSLESAKKAANSKNSRGFGSSSNNGRHGGSHSGGAHSGGHHGG